MDYTDKDKDIESITFKTKSKTSKSVFCSSALISALLCLCCCITTILITGCEGTEDQKALLFEQIDTITAQKTQLEDQLQQTQTENEQLKKQVQVLSALPENVKGENLYNIQNVKITKYTNLYDKDEDGKKEKLIVYLQPIDKEGDIVKATGDVEVQLWDLDSTQASDALLGQWRVTPHQLKELWYATLVTINYRLTFDVTDKVQTYDKPLTVKITFTDYLSGKIFKDQKAITPQAP